MSLLMRRSLTRVAAFLITASLAAWAALAAQTAPASGLQQFVVLQSEALTVPFETLTNEQAQCSISGNGNFATMRCLAPPGTAKAVVL